MKVQWEWVCYLKDQESICLWKQTLEKLYTSFLWYCCIYSSCQDLMIFCMGEEMWENFFVSLSTNIWRGHLLLLGQSQNLTEFDECLLKNNWRSLEIAINYCWYGWTDESKIYCITWIELVITIMWETSWNWIAWLMPHLIVNNLASEEVTLMAWWRVFLIRLECK